MAPTETGHPATENERTLASRKENHCFLQRSTRWNNVPFFRPQKNFIHAERPGREIPLSGEGLGSTFFFTETPVKTPPNSLYWPLIISE